MTHPATRGTSSKGVFCVVLAAGSAHRYGRTKQLENVDGRPLVGIAAGLAADVFGERTLLVTGHDWRPVEAAGRACRYFIVNERHAEGIGTSIAAAARVLGPAASAVVFLLADQPRVGAGGLRRLCAAWSGEDDHVVASAYAGTRGPPVLFPPAAFAELRRLEGDKGARVLVDSGRYRVTTVKNEAAGIDVDTPEDLERLGQPTERDASP